MKGKRMDVLEVRIDVKERIRACNSDGFYYWVYVMELTEKGTKDPSFKQTILKLASQVEDLRSGILTFCESQPPPELVLSNQDSERESCLKVETHMRELLLIPGVSSSPSLVDFLNSDIEQRDDPLPESPDSKMSKKPKLAKSNSDDTGLVKNYSTDRKTKVIRHSSSASLSSPGNKTVVKSENVPEENSAQDSSPPKQPLLHFRSLRNFRGRTPAQHAPDSVPVNKTVDDFVNELTEPVIENMFQYDLQLLFSTINSILEVVSIKKKMDPQSRNYMNFFLKMSKFLLGAKLMMKKNACTWAQLFYNQMIFSHEVISNSQVKLYTKANEKFLKIVKNTDHVKLLPLCYSFSNFLVRHKMDPNSALLGLEPNLSRFPFLKTVLRSNSYLNLLDNLDPEKQEEVQETVSEVINQKKPLLPGDVVLVKVGKKLTYARVNDNASPEFVQLFTSVNEHPKNFEKHDVFRLTDEMEKLLGDAKTMEEMIFTELDRSHLELKQLLGKGVKKFLVNSGSNVSLLEELKTATKVPLRKLAELKKTRIMLLNIIQFPKMGLELWEQLNIIASDQIKDFLKSHTTYGNFFIPTLTDRLKEYRRFPVNSVAISQLNSYVAICDLAIEKINTETHSIISGSKKNELAAWWLSVIKDDTTKYLRLNNFHFDEIPDNYTTEPPGNMIRVKKNLKLIEEILNYNEKYDLQGLIETLKDRIYRGVEEYVSEIKFLLADYFGITEDSFVLELLSERAKNKKNCAQWVFDIIKDYEYIEEMKRLETEGAVARSNDIVPISGLIVGKFVRIRNEIETVISIWDKKVEEVVEVHKDDSWTQFCFHEVYGPLLSPSLQEELLLSPSPSSAWVPIDSAGSSEAVEPSRSRPRSELLGRKNSSPPPQVADMSQSSDDNEHKSKKGKKKKKRRSVEEAWKEGAELLKRGKDVLDSKKKGQNPESEIIFESLIGEIMGMEEQVARKSQERKKEEKKTKQKPKQQKQKQKVQKPKLQPESENTAILKEAQKKFNEENHISDLDVTIQKRRKLPALPPPKKDILNDSG